MLLFITWLVVASSFLRIYANGEILQCDDHYLNYTSSQIDKTKECLGVGHDVSIWTISDVQYPCFGMCLLKSHEFISADGNNVVLDKVLQYINAFAKEKSKKMLLEMLTKCVNEHGIYFARI
ncbi:unnamed protein product, partial [Allacma fusca]